MGIMQRIKDYFSFDRINTAPKQEDPIVVDMYIDKERQVIMNANKKEKK
jgi:hypothetical protein